MDVQNGTAICIDPMAVWPCARVRRLQRQEHSTEIHIYLGREKV